MNGAPAKRIRVLIVEDSRTATQLLECIINADPRLEVAGAAASGEEALDALDRLKPDVITMDIHLPGIDGLQTTKRIMKRRPTPIIVVAADARGDQGKMPLNALKAGALSIVEKPRALTHAAFDEIAGRLCRQIVLMSSVKLVRQRRPDPISLPARQSASPEMRKGAARDADGAREIEAIGLVASTGGPPALAEVLSGLGADFPTPIFIIQHITSSFAESFVSWLNDISPMPVAIARHGETPKPGRVYVAPGEGRLEVAPQGMKVSQKPPVSSQRPSGTALFKSMAKVYGPACIGVLLTGMGDDGAAGLRAIYDAGGHTIAEDAASAVVFGMPAAAVALGAASEQLPLSHIAPRLRQLVLRSVRAAS